MKTKEMKKLIEHFDMYFRQKDALVCHPTNDTLPHIDVLVYEPKDIYPFWKLVTMGASDFAMPAAKNAPLGNRNEYIMFVDKSEDLADINLINKYVMYLMEVAMYPVSENVYITYSHSIEWTPNEGEEMVGAFIEFPQIIEDSHILRCKLGLFKTVTCLQVVLLTKDEINKLLEIGAEEFSYLLYPDSDDSPHFIIELKRTEKF